MNPLIRLFELINGVTNRHTDNNKDKYTPLHKAAENGDADSARILIMGGYDIYAEDNNKITPLHLAVKNNHTQVINLMREEIKKNYEIFKAVRNNKLPIKNTVGNYYKYYDEDNYKKMIIQRLKANGDLIRIRDEECNSLLSIAINSGYTKTAELLIAADADVNTINIKGDTPLHLAAKNNCLEAIDLLLDNGADVSATNREGFTPLHILAYHGYDKRIEELIKNNADVNAKTKNMNTPLHVAAKNGHKKAIEILIRNNADIHAKNKAGETPLDLARKEFQTEAIKFLEEKMKEIDKLFETIEQGDLIKIQDIGEDQIQITNKYGFIPLHLAVHHGYTGATLELIKKGSNVNAINNQDKQTPLHLAAKNGHSNIVTSLFNAGANLEAKDIGGHTPLHLAAYNNKADAISTLISLGANIHAKNKDGDTPLDLAVRAENKEATKLLKAKLKLSKTSKWRNIISSSRSNKSAISL